MTTSQTLHHAVDLTIPDAVDYKSRGSVRDLRDEVLYHDQQVTKCTNV